MLYQSTFPPAVQEGSLFSISSPAFIVCRFLKIVLFIWLFWVFIAFRPFPSCGTQGLPYLWCLGFLLGWLLLLQSPGSTAFGLQYVRAPGFRALAQSLWHTAQHTDLAPCGTWALPGVGSVSSSLAGRFSISESPGKPCCL